MAQRPMPAPAEGSPQEEQGESPDQESGEADAQGGSISDLIVMVDSGLTRIAGLVGQAKGIDPKVAQTIQQASQLFQSGIQALTGGQTQAAGPQPVAGSATMEQGANKSAMPAM